MSGSARTSALLSCLARPLLASASDCLPAACRQAFPAAAVTVKQAWFLETILEFIEASSGGSAAVCVAGIGGQGVKANCAPGDSFAGRQIRCHSEVIGWLFDMPTLQKIGDCCRRLLGSHGLYVQFSVRMSAYDSANNCARVVTGLAPHLSGISVQPLKLQTLLPAAAQLEHVAHINMDSENVSLLGQFRMLKELHVNVQHLDQLRVPLPQLHTLGLNFAGTLLRNGDLQCLLSQAPALRQLVLDRGKDISPWLLGAAPQDSLGLIRRDIEALVGLQSQQLDLLTVITSAIDEHTVSWLARLQCPLKLSINIDIAQWNLIRTVPLHTLLARLPNLVALTLENFHIASMLMWDQRGACLHNVQRLEISSYPLERSDSHLPLQSMLSVCPALKHLSLHSWPGLSYTAQVEVHACLCHAFKNCAKLVSLTCD